jgi:hypothetical protein
MFPQWLRYLVIATIAMSLSCVRALGSSPAENGLLRLVPANAAIVAGIEDPHHGDQSGRLLILTHNNHVDLGDWIALAGVDDRQEVDKLIEVAAASPRGDLSEHLLLARGSFNGRRILDDAEKSGGVATEYRGVRIVALKPFAREQREMPDTRWLAIVDDNITIFGTPAIVKSALDRYVSSSAADGPLMKRLQQLKPDVNCWSVLTMPAAALARHILPGALDESGSALLRTVSDVAIGIHYGSGHYGSGHYGSGIYESGERVDFAIGTEDASAAAAFAAALHTQPHLLPVADRLPPRVEGISVRQNEVRGSVRVKDKEFDSWLAAVYARFSVAGVAREENVAHAVAVR